MTDGNKIKQLRNEKAFTQEMLANKAGVTLKTIQRAEAGNVSNKSRLAIARALEVSPEELFLVSTPQPAEDDDFEFPDKDVEDFILYLLEQEELKRATNPHQEGHPVWFRNEQIQKDLGWGVGRINDAVELAEQYGWVFLSKEISGNRFNFVSGYLTGEGKIFADPNRRDDPTLLLRFLASQGEGDERGYQKLSVPELSEGLSWDGMRTEETIRVLKDRELVAARVSLGSPCFSRVGLTAEGRREARK